MFAEIPLLPASSLAVLPVNGPSKNETSYFTKARISWSSQHI